MSLFPSNGIYTPPSSHSWQNVSQAAKQIKCVLKVSPNDRFCHLLPPLMKVCNLHDDEPSQLTYSWPHLIQLHVTNLSSNAESLIWSFCSILALTYGSYFPSRMRNEKEGLEVWTLQLWSFQTVPPTKSRNPHFSQSLHKGFYSHIYLQNS